MLGLDSRGLAWHRVAAVRHGGRRSWRGINSCAPGCSAPSRLARPCGQLSTPRMMLQVSSAPSTDSGRGHVAYVRHVMASISGGPPTLGGDMTTTTL